MQPNWHTALIALIAAVLLGVIGDQLLRVGPWGVNIALFTVCAVIAVFAVARAGGTALRGNGRWLAIPAVLFAAMFIWRDAGMLKAANFLAVLVTLALFAAWSREGQMRLAGLADYALQLFIAGVYAMFGTLLLVLQDVKWGEVRRALPPGRLMSNITRVGVGVLLAAPLLLIFGALFTAADANFAQLINDLFNWDLDEFFSHLFAALFIAWLAGGFLHFALLAAPVNISAGSLTVDRLGIVETGTALGLLNGLFLAFVVLQFRYFFGTESALGYAEYARRGFFELVAVAALVLPVLLVAHWLLRKDNAAHVRIFNALAVALIVLLFVIMISALQRMALYVNAFGLTELRLYTTAFMGWLALVFGWFVITVLRGQRARFAFGALAAVLLVGGALNVMNPDDFIARTNISRITDDPAARELDARYLAGLSADAVPALLGALPNAPEEQRCRAAEMLIARWEPPAETDWRTWNYSRWQAQQHVGARMDELTAYTPCEKP